MADPLCGHAGHYWRPEEGTRWAVQIVEGVILAVDEPCTFENELERRWRRERTWADLGDA